MTVETNNRQRKRYMDRGVDEDLSMVATYTQVENAFGLQLIYSQIL